jgi:biopolymer transport protein ExbD
MPAVNKPEKHLFKDAPLAFVRKAGKGHGGANVIADLNVTPMVDMLTMLVIFLLLTFSANGEILTINKDIQMPKAFNAVELERNPIIAVSRAQILFETQMVMDASTINNDAFPDFVLPELKKRLDTYRELKKLDPRNSGKPFDPNIIIQSDNSVPFVVIKMIMMTCARSDFTSMNFAVLRGDRKEAGLGEAPGGAPAAP